MGLNKEEKEVALELLRKKNVVAVGHGTKQVEGKDTRRPAIVVSVKKKVPIETLSKKDRIPAFIKGMKTDVVEVGGEIRVLRHRAPVPYSAWPRQSSGMGKRVIPVLDITARERPAHPGCSIGHHDITAGTFGAVVYRNSDGAPRILSNNHVLANVNKGDIGDAILQPGAYDGGVDPGDQIARLCNFVHIETVNTSDCKWTNALIKAWNWLSGKTGHNSRLSSYRSVTNKVDCALAEPLNPQDIHPLITDVGVVTGVVSPAVGMEVMKRGRTTEITQGKIDSIDNMVNVNMGDGDVAIFEDQVIISGIGGAFSAGGDSGSLILDKGRRAVCLLFAGNDSITIGNDINNVLSALDVRLVR